MTKGALDSPAAWQGSRAVAFFAAWWLMLAVIASQASRQTTSLRKPSVPSQEYSGERAEEGGRATSADP